VNQPQHQNFHSASRARGSPAQTSTSDNYYRFAPPDATGEAFAPLLALSAPRRPAPLCDSPGPVDIRSMHLSARAYRYYRYYGLPARESGIGGVRRAM
jgi:hypothetical protein